MTTGRGVLTDRVQQVAQTHLGREISLTELRLIPYIHFTMTNTQRLCPSRITPEERAVLQTWREAGWIEGGASGLAVSEGFWEAMNAVLWVAYVDYEGGDHEHDQ